MGHLEPALALGVGAGERAFLVAEQLAFQQAVAQRGAVDPHEGAQGPPALVVDQQGDQLFARSALAADQHRHRRGGDPLGQRDGLEQPGALAHDLIEGRSALLGRGGGRHPAIGQQAVEQVFHGPAVQRLEQEIAAARLDRANGRLRARGGAGQDRRPAREGPAIMTTGISGATDRISLEQLEAVGRVRRPARCAC